MLNHYDRERLIWQSSYEPFTKMLLLALNSFVDGNGECWPGLETLAEMCGMSRSSVIRKLQALQNEEVLVIVDRRDQQGRQTSNLYRVDFEQLGRVSGRHPGVSGRHGEGVTVTRGGCQGDTGEGVTVTPDLSNLDLSIDLSKDLSLKESEPRERKIASQPEPEPIDQEDFRAFVTGRLRPTCKGNLIAYVNAALKSDQDAWLVEYRKHQETRVRNDAVRAEATNQTDFAVNPAMGTVNVPPAARDCAVRRDNFRRQWDSHPDRRSVLAEALSQQPELGLFVMDGQLCEFGEMAA
jgi:biotin operon repressor